MTVEDQHEAPPPPPAQPGFTWLKLPLGARITLEIDARAAPGGWVEILTSEIEKLCALDEVF